MSNLPPDQPNPNPDQPPPQMYPPPPPGYESPGSAPAYPNYSPPGATPPPGYYPAPPPGYAPPPPGYYPGYPPASYGYPYQQPRRVSGCVWAALIVGGGIFVVCAGFLIFGVVLVLGWSGEGSKASDQFLQAAKVSDIDKMYNLLSPDGQRSFSKTRLRSFVDQRKAYLPNYSNLTANLTKLESATSRNFLMTLSGTALYTDGKKGNIRVELLQNGNNWLIQDITLDAPV